MSNQKKLAEELKEIYEDKWCFEFVDMDSLLSHFRVCSEVGKCNACVYVDSQKQYHQVKDNLWGMGFDCEDYNGGGNGILEITW